MEINEIYQVERDDYVGALRAIDDNCKDVIVTGQGEPHVEIHTYNIDHSRHFASRIIDKLNDDIIETYYVIDMPTKEERCPPKPVQRIVLETREEVQAFIDILNKIQKGEINND